MKSIMNCINENEPKPLILASQSPRRKYLLEQAGLDFSIIPSRVDESSIHLDDPEAYVKTLSELKACDIGNEYPDHWVIGADTVVVMGNTVLEKPVSKADAHSMLTKLSGQTHKVLTGYCLVCRSQNQMVSDVVATEVTFKNLTAQELEWYIHTPEPFDKAGAYAIQGLGTFLVKTIKGSYTNVVGLPVCEIIELLLRLSVIEHTIGKMGYSVSE